MNTKQLQKPNNIKFAGLYLMILGLLFSCKSGQVNLFKPASPHEQYQRKLVAAGLDKTSMGSAWIVSSLSVFQKALNINIPYQETGYFPAESVSATAYRFNIVQGQKISIKLSRKGVQPFMIYIDIWEQAQNGQMKLVAAADTIDQSLQFEAKTSGSVFIRLQPELLRGGQYTLNINTGPSLGFPVKSSNSRDIKSIFGDGRDENSRKHEGIDIFAAFRTPAVAAAGGTVTRVNENNLGGKVVWLRPKDKDYTLYYAHLDLQTAKEGQQVVQGDTLGLVGNTGNAKSTSSHLHFGIYTSGGAVDPLPFVNTVIKNPPVISSAVSNLNSTMRTRAAATLYASTDQNARTITSLKSGTIVKVNSANSSWYKIELPDGQPGFIQAKALTSINKPLLKLKVTSAQQELYDYPDSLHAAVKLTLKTGTQLEVLGNYNSYQLVKNNTDQTGWIDTLP
ncbi:M23 family metallopeptidase [Pedobacter sp. MC2016-15]|uniref:M23 family metallopeptidase n=1 Tax=Pedobacter sp. MC2016-15 TaxID=2994473 RepID=UPI002247D65D|nr:M23 family metallopeptidase [Pedobacter sp. MC2016-15]MCX2480472.1 M23 family metallopeptidase [Pedobacter sp. MC2016-15]